MTGLIVAAILVGLIILVGGFTLFVLLPALLATVGVLLLVLVMAGVSVLMLPHFVTLDDFKPQILDALKQSTGREIAIGGPIGFSVWPVLGIQLRDISIGNPAGSADPIMLAAKEVGVGVTLSSLLDHKLELRELRIVEAQLNLTEDPSGRGNNWQITPAPKAEASSDAKPFDIKDVQIEKVELIDSSVSYDPAKGDSVDLDDIDISLRMPGLDSPAKFSGDLTQGGKEYSMTVELNHPRALISGEGVSHVEAVLKVDSNRVVLQGDLKKTTFDGALEATLAGITAKGPTTLQWGGAKPRVEANLTVGLLNIDKLAGTAPASMDEKAPAAEASSASAPNLAGLESFNADITAQLEGVIVKGAQLGATTAKINVSGGKLTASLSPATLYGGTLAAKLEASQKSGFALASTLESVDVQPVLKQFAGFDRLSGKGDFSVNLRGPVADVASLKRQIDGEGRVMLRNGTIQGVNIAALVSNAKSVLGGGQAAQDTSAQQTAFTELSGTYRIVDGLVSNNDLKLLSPVVRVAGKGTASLPTEAVDYRIDASLLADTAGASVVIPINVRGTFSSLKYEPDLQGLVLGNLDTVKSLGTKEGQRNAREAVKGILGLPQKGTTTEEKPANPLKNLFGR